MVLSSVSNSESRTDCRFPCQTKHVVGAPRFFSYRSCFLSNSSKNEVVSLRRGAGEHGARIGKEVGMESVASFIQMPRWLL